MKNYIYLLLACTFSFQGFAQSTYNDIAPILYKNCTSCHRPGGGAPFSMLTYNEIQPWTTSMIHALQHGEMPPWGADTSYVHFVNERPISQADKDTLLAWIFGGSLEGDPTQVPPPPTYPQYQLNGTPDMIVQMPLFKSNANTSDAYNTLVVPVPTTQSRFIRAIELVPADPSLVHHSLIVADTAGKIPFDTTGQSITIAGDIAIGTWAPGSLPIVYPNSPQLKMGIAIPANAEIGMQIHTPKGTFGQTIDIQLRLYFYPVNETGIRPVYDFVPLQYWSNDFWIGPEQIKSFSVEQITYPYNISIFSAFPHSHQICTEILNYAYHPLSNDTIPLIKIDRWDFEHQEYYYYKNLVKIAPGYRFHSDHTFDNTSQNHHNPNNPPQMITVGYNTDDEMLFDGFQYIHYQAGDENINIDSILKNDPLLNTISIHENGMPMIVSKVYPNPVTDASFIEFNSIDKDWSSYTLNVVNLNGQKVNMLESMKDGRFEIHRNGLNDGVYFYEILKDNRKISAGRILVQ
jgi:hypothetical protein